MIDSASSADSSKEDVPKPAAKGHSTIQESKPSTKPAKDLEQEASLQLQASRVQELFLAFRMKQEEMRSLQRLSDQLEHYRGFLEDRIKRMKGEELAACEGFKDEVEWEATEESEQTPDVKE